MLWVAGTKLEQLFWSNYDRLLWWFWKSNDFEDIILPPNIKTAKKPEADFSGDIMLFSF